jgi:hypothetical protein
MWMRGYFDRLPEPVRRRLADSRHNICPACLTEEAGRTARAQGLNKRPTVTTFLDLIREIEQQLDEGVTT